MAGKCVQQIQKSREERQNNVVAVRKDLSSLRGLWKIAGYESQP
jgi:hypothetical protein